MKVDGLLAHRLEGEGEPLLILNGGLMTYASWEPVSGRLAQRYRLILNDMRGQLLSPGTPPSTLAGNVDDLVALLDHLEIDSAHVLGTSFGGEVAILLAGLRPERVRSLIAVTVTDHATGAIGAGVEALREIVADSLAGGDKGRLHDRVVEEVYSPAFREKHAVELAERRRQVASLPDVWFEGLNGIVDTMHDLDVRPYLDAIRCPTLVVIAANDQTMPPERSRALAAAISGAEIRVHESSGHALVVEDPNWLADVSLEFLARQNRKRLEGKE